MDGPGGRSRAEIFILEGGSEIVQVQVGASVGGFGFYEDADHLLGAAEAVKRLEVLQHAPAPGQDVADVEPGLEPGGCEPHPNRHGEHGNDVGRRSACDGCSQHLCEASNPWQRVGDGPDRRQLASRLSPSVDDRASGREQRQHDDQAQPHS